jgi:hypothetical protein
MRHIIATYLPWFISASTIYMLWQIGNLNRKGWILGGFNQILWLSYIIAAEAWGLLPLNIAMCWITIRNYLKWKGI